MIIYYVLCLINIIGAEIIPIPIPWGSTQNPASTPRSIHKVKINAFIWSINIVTLMTLIFNFSIISYSVLIVWLSKHCAALDGGSGHMNLSQHDKCRNLPIFGHDCIASISLVDAIIVKMALPRQSFPAMEYYWQPWKYYFSQNQDLGAAHLIPRGGLCKFSKKIIWLSPIKK